MAYPEILRDKRKAAIPQLWDGSNWRPLKGTKDGHQQTQLVGPDGQPIGSENPLEVRVRELEEKLDAMNQLLQSGDAKMQLTGQIEVLYEGPVSTITAGSSVALVPKRPTEFKEVRGGIAVTSATRGDWRLYVSHLHASVGNNFGSEDLVRLNDTVVGGSGAKNLLSSHFEVRVLNNNSFDAGIYRASILGVR